MPTTPPSIYTKPADISPDTLANLGPLRALAGVWQGTVGADVHPNKSGAKDQVFVEDYQAQPIDPQTNGPQLFYGLRYHTHITKPDKTATFHDQDGYWLWEPATNTVMLTASIPRGQVLLAGGQCDADATTFTVKATLGAPESVRPSMPKPTARPLCKRQRGKVDKPTKISDAKHSWLSAGVASCARRARPKQASKASKLPSASARA